MERNGGKLLREKWEGEETERGVMRHEMKDKEKHDGGRRVGSKRVERRLLFFFCWAPRFQHTVGKADDASVWEHEDGSSRSK